MARNIIKNIAVMGRFAPHAKINITDISEYQIKKWRFCCDISKQGYRDLLRIQVQLLHHKNHIINKILRCHEMECIAVNELLLFKNQHIESLLPHIKKNPFIRDQVFKIHPDAFDQQA